MKQDAETFATNQRCPLLGVTRKWADGPTPPHHILGDQVGEEMGNPVLLMDEDEEFRQTLVSQQC